MQIIPVQKRLCGGDAQTLSHWVTGGRKNWVACVATICIGCGAYGFTIGIWRAPLQGFYAAMKFPVLVLLTTLGNCLINGMFAQLLGLRISFRESSLAILSSFAIAAMILGAIAPIMLFITFNTPPLEHGARASAHAFTLLMHVVVIAFAGTLANLRLFGLLRHLSDTRAVATRVLLSWLAINFLLGSQLAWNLRPFIGSPGLPVRPLRPDAFRGSFYETVYRSTLRLTTSTQAPSDKKGNSNDSNGH